MVRSRPTNQGDKTNGPGSSIGRVLIELDIDAVALLDRVCRAWEVDRDEAILRMTAKAGAG